MADLTRRTGVALWRFPGGVAVRERAGVDGLGNPTFAVRRVRHSGRQPPAPGASVEFLSDPLTGQLVSAADYRGSG
jgi:hypothetical protein